LSSLPKKDKEEFAPEAVARYPDIKRDFRRRCTEEYTAEQMMIVREMFEWLKSHLTS